MPVCITFTEITWHIYKLYSYHTKAMIRSANQINLFKTNVLNMLKPTDAFLFINPFKSNALNI